jgi:uncharacterized membrane protein YobD (UPF0266 family)
VRKERESKMQVNEIQMKVIAIGLVPIFLFLSFVLPKTTTTAILLGAVMLTGFVVCFIGMSKQKQEVKEHEDLLAIPPKKS